MGEGARPCFRGCHLNYGGSHHYTTTTRRTLREQGQKKTLRFRAAVPSVVRQKSPSSFVFSFGVWVSREEGSEEEVKEERGFYLSVFGLGERAEVEDFNAGSGSRALPLSSHPFFLQGGRGGGLRFCVSHDVESDANTLGTGL